jgi:hypothetical protein
MLHSTPSPLEVHMSGPDAILERLDRLEREVASWRRQARAWRIAAVAAVLGVVALPITTDAAKSKTSIELHSADGRAEARFTAQGFEYQLDGASRVKFDVGDTWDRLTFYRQGGAPSVSVGTDDGLASVRLFSADEKLRLELSENTLGLGAGMRLFDETGKGRVAVFSGHASQATGLRITDDEDQPRIVLTSEPGGEAQIRATDSAAQSMVEISVLHESDAVSRQLGYVPELDNDPLVPMVFLLDASGTSRLVRAAEGP